MEKKTFNAFREIVYEKSGINLNESKEALVAARVSKRMRALGLDNYKKYLEILNEDQSGEEVVHLLDAISTNVTHFFRESNHFKFLEDIFSQWVAKGQKRFRIWSAASSSGEEPYSIAMTLAHTVKQNNLDLKILGTDISTKVLAACLKGEYEASKVEKIPKNYLNEYFTKSKQSDKQMYTVTSELKRMLVFRRLNLSTTPFPMRGPLDVVFCRNVMIYFDNFVRKKLLDEIYRLLKPGGYLMVGHAESLTSIVSDFQATQPSIYIKK